MIKPYMIPNTGIKWRKPPTHIVEMVVDESNLFQAELTRLEAKYGKALSKKEMAHELDIGLKTLERRIISCEDIPEYKELRTKRVIFPLTAVATYLSMGLIKTA